MKICLLISGHLRTFRQCLASQKSFLVDELGCDVFMHSWNEIESKTVSWHNSHMKNRIVSESDKCFVRDILKPKGLIFEDQIDYGLNKNLANSSISLNGLKNMTFGFKRVYELMKEYQAKTETKYDLIIKIRPDIMLKKPLAKSILNLKNNSILFFGNNSPIVDHDGETNFYHKFRALDIISACTNDNACRGVYNLFDNFEEYYGKKSWHHSPYLDYVIDEKIPFNISLRYMYGNAWEIKRG